MKKLFLMSLFGLFMIAATNAPSVSGIAFVSSAFASDSEDDDSEDNTTTSENNDSENNTTTSENNDSENNTTTSENDDSEDNSNFSCPDGITTCYKADGTAYNDVNNLPATAAGSPGGSSTPASVVKPGHFRSF